MAWEGSTRRARLPKDWQARRRAALARDRHQCQVISEETGFICGEKATEVDHIRPGDNHNMSNLQAICQWHHRRKSSAEGNAAKIKIAPRNRPSEKHPGAL